MSLGQNLRNARTKANLTQQQLAEVIGVQQSTLSGYENKNHLPAEDILVKLGDTMNVSLDYLFGRTNNPYPLVDYEDSFCGEITYGDIIEALRNASRDAKFCLALQIMQLDQNKESCSKICKKLKTNSHHLKKQ